MKQNNRLLILVCAIVFPIEKIGNILLIHFFAIEIIISLINRKPFKFHMFKQGFCNPITFLFFITIFILKLRNPIGAFDKDLSLLFFPIYFSLANLKKDDVLYFLKYYVFLLFLFLLSACIYEIIAQYYFDSYVNLWKLTIHYNNSKVLYFFHAVSERLDFHHIYLTLYLFIGFLIGFFILKNKVQLKNIEKKSIIISMTFFLVFSFLSLSRMTIICFVILGIYYLVEIIIQNKSLKKGKYIFILVLILLGTVFSTSEFAKTQFDKISKDPRSFLFQSSLKLSQDSYIIGLGTKKASIMLQKEQQKEGHVVILNNSHNQYLDYLLGGGLVMLTIFIVLNGIMLLDFKFNNNHLAIMVQLFFLIQLLTESLLYRYRGIVLYALFMSLFYNYNNNKRIIV